MEVVLELGEHVGLEGLGRLTVIEEGLRHSGADLEDEELGEPSGVAAPSHTMVSSAMLPRSSKNSPGSRLTTSMTSSATP